MRFIFSSRHDERAVWDNKRVGTFLHPVTLIGSAGERITVDALVETGSTFSSMPGAMLSTLGIEPQREVRLRLADGTSQVKSLGHAVVEVDGVEEVIPIVFGNEESPPTLGALTLEALLLGVDTVGQRLIPVEGWQA